MSTLLWSYTRRGEGTFYNVGYVVAVGVLPNMTCCVFVGLNRLIIYCDNCRNKYVVIVTDCIRWLPKSV